MAGRSQPSEPDEEPILLDVPRFAQPDDVTCGPTCLSQVLRYYGMDLPVEEAIRRTRRNPDGGTLAVYLGLAALGLGFRATIYSYNMRVFDPTWRRLSPAALSAKLEERRAHVEGKKLGATIEAYRDLLSLGGRIRFDELTADLLVRHLRRGEPILTGLSATYLYRTPRELNEDYDDVRGNPAGHFVVICGYYPKSDRFVVRDPSPHIPFSRSGKYSVPADRLLNSILLGDLTHDAVLLALTRRR